MLQEMKWANEETLLYSKKRIWCQERSNHPKRTANNCVGVVTLTFLPLHADAKVVLYFTGVLLSAYCLACKGTNRASLQTWPTVLGLYSSTISLVESLPPQICGSWTTPMLRSPACKFASHTVLNTSVSPHYHHATRTAALTRLQ